MIVILTALQVECAAVREHLVGVEVHRHDAGTLFDVGGLAARPDRRIALATTGMGNTPAAVLTERAIAKFRPTAMLFVGIAGALRPWLELGDVVVATRVHAYHGGRSEDDEFLARPRSWDVSHKIEQVARRLPWTAEWRGTGQTPAVHFEPVAAGEVVLNSRRSSLAQQLHRNYNDAVAIEMESAGFALAGHLNDRVPLATVRAISDHADGNKETVGDGWQQVAARNAAAFAVAIAAGLEDDAQEAPSSSSSGPLIQNTNVTRDNSRVGQQIGINLGDFRSQGEN